MKLAVTCLGLSHHPPAPANETDLVYRLPRVSMARICQQFLPDFALLLLVDELVLDRATFEGVIRGHLPTAGATSLVLQKLHAEGFLRLEDLPSTLDKTLPAVLSALEADLRKPDPWLAQVSEWHALWRDCYQTLQVTLRASAEQIRLRRAAQPANPGFPDCARQASSFLHDLGGRFQMVNFYAEEALPARGGPPDVFDRKALVDLLREQLLYVHANLLASQQLHSALHDWCDARPFYLQRLQSLSSGAFNATAQPVFSLALPEFTYWHPDNILRALGDPRVADLRARVRATTQDGQAFDLAAARQVLAAVQSIEQGIAGVRTVDVYVPPRPKKPVAAKGRAKESSPALTGPWFFSRATPQT